MFRQMLAQQSFEKKNDARAHSLQMSSCGSFLQIESSANENMAQTLYNWKDILWELNPSSKQKTSVAVSFAEVVQWKAVPRRKSKNIGSFLI